MAMVHCRMVNIRKKRKPKENELRGKKMERQQIRDQHAPRGCD
jgi:hypothetical protein